MSRPLCRACGKPIAKRTSRLRFGCAPVEAEQNRGRVERPATKDEAQRYVNGEIIQLKYSTRAYEDAPEATPPPWHTQGPYRATRSITVPRFVGEVIYWDGESYQDDLFDSLSCAAKFGRLMARQFPDHATPAYHEAAKTRRAAKGAA